MRVRSLVIVLGLAALVVAPRAVQAQAELLEGYGGPRGFGGLALDWGDDAPSFQVDLTSVFPTGLDFFGRNFHGVWININGNITFGAAYSVYTPAVFPASPHPMIAPFWGDVDLRGGNVPNHVYYALDRINERFIVTWWKVGYFNAHSDKVNSFQLILTRRADLGAGDFDVEFRYRACLWTTGDVTGEGGFGGNPAVAGFDAGNRSDYEVIPGSGTHNVLQLCNTSNVNETGVWRFRIRTGAVEFCGDGQVAAGEVCDDGPSNSNAQANACRLNCLPAACGDGVIDAGESCDLGMQNGTPDATCSAACQVLDTEWDPPIEHIERPDVPDASPIDDVLQQNVDRLWADRTFPVVWNRYYRKESRHALSLTAGIVFDDPFIDYYPLGLRYRFHVSEVFGFELSGSYVGDIFRSDAALTGFLTDAGATVRLEDRLRWRAGAGLVFSPFYGKLSLLSNKLFHLDLWLSAGAGVVATRPETLLGDALGDEALIFEGSVGVGMTIFLGRNSHLDIGYRQSLFDGALGLAHPAEISLSFGVLFPLF